MTSIQQLFLRTILQNILSWYTNKFNKETIYEITIINKYTCKKNNIWVEKINNELKNKPEFGNISNLIR